jgi:hypothetical protein
MNSDNLYNVLVNCKRKNEIELFNNIRAKYLLAVYRENFAYDEAETRLDNFKLDDKACLAVYEAVLRLKHGKRQIAGYTRKSNNNHGHLKSVLLSIEKGPADGYEELKAIGALEYSNEALVLKYPDLFPAHIVEMVESYHQN